MAKLSLLTIPYSKLSYRNMGNALLARFQNRGAPLTVIAIDTSQSHQAHKTHSRCARKRLDTVVLRKPPLDFHAPKERKAPSFKFRSRDDFSYWTTAMTSTNSRSDETLFTKSLRQSLRSVRVCAQVILCARAGLGNLQPGQRPVCRNA